MNLLGHPISYEYDQIHSLQRSTSSHILSFTRQRIIFSEFSKKIPITKWETFEIKHVIRQNDLSPSFLTPVLNKIHHIVFVRERSKHKCNACTNPDAHDSCDTNSRK